MGERMELVAPHTKAARVSNKYPQHCLLSVSQEGAEMPQNTIYFLLDKVELVDQQYRIILSA